MHPNITLINKINNFLDNLYDAIDIEYPSNHDHIVSFIFEDIVDNPKYPDSYSHKDIINSFRKFMELYVDPEYIIPVEEKKVYLIDTSNFNVIFYNYGYGKKPDTNLDPKLLTDDEFKQVATDTNNVLSTVLSIEDFVYNVNSNQINWNTTYIRIL